jgi:hypothetical protein
LRDREQSAASFGGSLDRRRAGPRTMQAIAARAEMVMMAVGEAAGVVVAVASECGRPNQAFLQRGGVLQGDGTRS